MDFQLNDWKHNFKYIIQDLMGKTNDWFKIISYVLEYILSIGHFSYLNNNRFIINGNIRNKNKK